MGEGARCVGRQGLRTVILGRPSGEGPRGEPRTQGSAACVCLGSRVVAPLRPRMTAERCDDPAALFRQWASRRTARCEAKIALRPPADGGNPARSRFRDPGRKRAWDRRRVRGRASPPSGALWCGCSSRRRGRSVSPNRDISHLDEVALRPLRRDLQVIFQDPLSSLNPRLTVATIVGRPLLFQGLADNARTRARWPPRRSPQSGLPKAFADRYPHELSGGQRQRVGIARAIALKPRFRARRRDRVGPRRLV